MLRYPLICSLAIGPLLASSSVAADLRVETRVYEADSDQPMRQSVTLFKDNVVYDFREQESQVTIYRPSVGNKPARFILIDTKREVRTEITADRVAAVMVKLRDWAAQQKDPFLNFIADPNFQEAFNAESGELRLVSDQLSYRLVTIPTDHPEMKLAVREFLDQYAQLQTLLDAGLPPEPRLRVNEALFRHGVMPVEVQVLSGRLDDQGSVEPDVWADYLTAWVLSKNDHQLIDEAIDQMATFAEVSNKEFQAGRQRLASK